MWIGQAASGNNYYAKFLTMLSVRLAFIIADAAVLFLSGCSTMSTCHVNSANISSYRYDSHRDLDGAVETIAGSLVRKGETPGLVVGLLLPDGSTRFFGYGTTEQREGTTPDGDTLFAVGSLSKGFLGAVTAVLVQEGRLSWTDTLSNLLSPDVPLSRSASQITVEQLATHTSGLPRQPMTFETLSYFIQYLFTGDNFYRHFDQSAVLGYLATFDTPPIVEPQYSNIGYGLLGYVLEYRTGKTLDNLLAEQITGPLGLAHTGYIPEELPGYVKRARGHAGDQPKFIQRGQPVPDWRFTEIMKGTGAIYSNASDLLIFAAACMHDDDIPLYIALRDTMRARYSRPQHATAVAWMTDDIDDVRIVYQVGMVAGYSSYLGLNLNNHTAVVVLQNAFNWDYSIGHTLLLMLADR